jgi:serine/threonine-protein kinase
VDTAVPAGGAALQGTADPLVGRLLDGRYRLDRAIARGGMATVYRATDTRLDRVVAVKVLRAALADDPEFVERFTREARSAARLSSPDVVAVFDQGRDAASGLAYLVMEHVPGRTLRDVLHEHGTLSPVRALTILEPVLRALSAAHAAGLVHRDVKPENVLVGDDGRVKVADFGLARAFHTSSVTATTGLLLGTVAYLAPEQVERGAADPRTDVYAAGIVLWELLTGSPPYAADSPLSVAYRHVNEDVPPPSTAVPGVPPSVDDLVLRATRRDPAARPVDAGAFLAEVRAVLADLPEEHETVVVRQAAPGHPTLVVPRPEGAPPRPQRPVTARRSRRGLVGVLVVALLALAAVTGGWYLGTGRYQDVPGVVRADQATATARLRDAGFSVRVDRTPRHDEAVPAGQVLDQSPDAGSRARRGATVTIVLSLGADRRAVPDLTGKDVAAATAALEAVGLRAGTVVEEFSNVPKGGVVRSDPGVGQQLRPDTAVQLVVSKGPELLPVPVVVGKQQDAATQALTDAGFTATVQQVFNDAPKGTAVAQDPAKGTAPRGSAVVLQVSKGPDLVVVPDVRGQDRDTAQAALKAAGLAVRVFAVPAGPGRVLSTDPGAGSKVKRGSSVTLYVF